ncbi:hypothetical protein GX48_01812 [Paracoccidioides brasiliensis]|nr:hypothetical protein GX48_01812 [Paracoccidioides brasiliensis]
MRQVAGKKFETSSGACDMHTSISHGLTGVAPACVVKQAQSSRCFQPASVNIPESANLATPHSDKTWFQANTGEYNFLCYRNMEFRSHSAITSRTIQQNRDPNF